MTIRHSTLLALCSLATPALAAERDFEVLPGQRILLKGDSITRGYAFGNYTDPSPLRRIPDIGAMLLRDNLARPPAFLRLENYWEGIGEDGKAKTTDSLAAEIRMNIARGELRTGDWLIFEDAGPIDKAVHPAPWPWTKDIYQNYRKLLRDMVHAAENTVGRDHILFMTMFDYQPKCGQCGWDAPLDDGKHSGNDAIRDEARELGIRVIDMNAIMDAAHEYLTKRGWGRAVGPDGVHPNVYGNFVMTAAILRELGADVSKWKIGAIEPRLAPESAGGDIGEVWGFTRNPDTAERRQIARDLRDIVAGLPRAAEPTATRLGGVGIQRIVHHGRLLATAVRQPEGTSNTVIYELGKIFQLDRSHLLLVASMREQGGHDFCVGNDGFVFETLSDIAAEKAIPINRLDPHYKLAASGAPAVQGRFPASGGFVPLGAKLADGKPHPGAGTGFLFSGALTFLPDRSNGHPQATRADRTIEFIQLRWDGKALHRTGREFVDKFEGIGVGRVPLSNCLEQDKGFLCPFPADDGSHIVVVRFDFDGKRWKTAGAGKPFGSAPEPAATGAAYVYRYRETEPSIQFVGGRYLLHTRGRDPKGRVYSSADGLNYTLAFDHPNHTVPQVMNQGLDGSLYISTNTGPGYLRNPLLAFPVEGEPPANSGTPSGSGGDRLRLARVPPKLGAPLVIHDEKGLRDPKGKEVPFADHGVGGSFLVAGKWRHLFLYRVCDLRETNGEGLGPQPHTGLYLAEMEYSRVTSVPFRF